MKYRITVEEVTEPTDASKYTAYVEIYQQVAEDLDVSGLVVAINQRDSLEVTRRSAPFSTDEHEVIERRVNPLQRMYGAIIETTPPAQVAVPPVESLRFHVGHYRITEQVRPLD